MKKTRIVTCVLLLLLSVSLLTMLNAQPVQAITPNRDAIALKEYKIWTSYNPSYTFLKNDGVLQMMSTQNGLGFAYAFLHIDKSCLHGNKLRIRWRWYYDYLDWQTVSLAQVYVVNNLHNRKLENSGEFRTQGDIEHPVADYLSINPLNYAAVSNGGWISWDTPTSNVMNLNGFSSTVTIMIKAADYWIQHETRLQVDYLQILDSNNQVLKTYDFSNDYSDVYMDKTGGYYDFGRFLEPNSVLYGTRNYAEETGAPEGELQESQLINYEIFNLFSNRRYYVGNLWGDPTEMDNVYTFTYISERYYDYSMVLYKGHTWPLGSWCNEEPCPLFHNAVYNDAGTDVAYCIRDYMIDDMVIAGLTAASKHGTHYFVFMWCCGLANISASSIGVFSETHSSSFLPSWMHFDPWSLNNDGYIGTPDYSDRVFIGFEWLSKYYRDLIPEDPNYNYGTWMSLFYYFLLNGGCTVKEALDYATFVTHNGRIYGDSQLHGGYWAINPMNDLWEWSRMRIWGDVSTRLPR